MEFINAFFSQPWIGSVAGIIGIAVGIVGLILYRASRIGSRLVYQLRVIRLLGTEEQELPHFIQVMYHGFNIQRLTKVYVILWNAGNATLDSDKIVPNDPLRLQINNGEAISVSISKTTREANNFRVDAHPGSSTEKVIRFDYLDPGDGAVIELLHTGRARYPKIRGTIRGSPRGPLNWGTTPSRYTEPGLMFCALGAVMFLIGIIQPLYTLIYTYLGRISVLVMGAAFLLVGVSTTLRSRKRFPKSLMIQDLDT